jgi:hypothetical protein
MQLNHVIEMSLIEAENEGLSKQEAIEYAARANNVTVDIVADVYNNLIEWQDRIADKLGIRL